MKPLSEMPRSIVTPRLRLEAIGPQHARGLWDAARGSLDELRPWMTWALDASAESIRSYTVDAARAWIEGGDYSYVVLVEGRPAGSIGLNRVVPLHRRGELGYWLSSELAGRGLTTEAAGAVVEAAFTAGWRRIELRAAPDNVGSVRVAEKLGFRREGIARDSCLGAHGWHDLVLFSLLATDDRPPLPTMEG